MTNDNGWPHPAARPPTWATRVLAPNPGPMTLDGTNTWVLRGPDGAGAVVVDPGPADEGHLRRILALGPVSAVLITHTHPDHVAGLDRFVQLAGLDPHRVGRVPDDPATIGLLVEPIATPGHTADSVSFVARGLDGADPAVLTGDTVLGAGTAMVAWPDGDLTSYLDSLRRLARLWPLPVLPGHGPPRPDCAAATAAYLEHRLARLAQVQTAVDQGATTPTEVVGVVYPGLDPRLLPAAELTVRAQLAHLAATGH